MDIRQDKCGLYRGELHIFYYQHTIGIPLDAQVSLSFRLYNVICYLSRIFGGVLNDVKRKLPWYMSDFRDGIALQCLASFGFIYFACLTPIVTFGGLLGAATDNHLVSVLYITFLPSHVVHVASGNLTE